jgi:hypothetical protein
MLVGARFSAPLQTDHGAQPNPLNKGYRVFPGVKRAGRGADQPPPFSTVFIETVQLYLHSLSGPSWPFYCELYLTLQINNCTNANTRNNFRGTESILINDPRLFNLLKSKPNLLYITNQSVPRCKHFSSRL